MHRTYPAPGTCTVLPPLSACVLNADGIDTDFPSSFFCPASERDSLGKYSLILVSGFVIAFGMVNQDLNSTSADLYQNYWSQYERVESKQIARSLTNMALAALGDSVAWRAGYTGFQMGGGVGSATVHDPSTDTSLAAGEVRIVSTGRSGGEEDTVIVLAIVSGGPGVPPGVHGGITARSVVKTLGSLVIDGRDHDLNGNLLLGQGTMGVSTTQTFDQGGVSKAGGTTAGGIDHIPARPADASIVEEGATYIFPSDPDAVFGHPSGSLKTMAQSGVNGGQYVTDPAHLSFPLTGVTYVELASGATWEAIDFGNSSGVLVVHNSSVNALMKNLNGGKFTGLIIADDIEHIHTDVVGAVVSLTTSPSGNCIGNGSGSVLYSSAALSQASSVSSGGPAGGGNVAVASWYE